MDLSLPYLVLFAVLAFSRPLLAAAFLLTFTEATAWPVLTTTARNISLIVLVTSTGLHLLRRPRKEMQEFLHKLASNPLAQIFMLLGAFYLLGRRPIEDFDQIAAKRLLIYSIVPLICALPLIRDKRGAWEFIGGLIMGLVAQIGFEFYRYGLQLNFMAAEELRMGIDSTSNSHMLFSGWLAMFVITGVFMYICQSHWWLKCIGIGLATGGTVLLLYSGTRSGLGGAIVGAAVIVVGSRKFLYGFVAAGVLFGVGIFYSIMGSSVMSVRLTEFWTNPADASAVRLQLYKAALFQDFPNFWLLGTGTARSGEVTAVTIWDRARGPYSSDTFYRINYENLPLTVLVELGLIGCGLLALILRKSVRIVIAVSKQYWLGYKESGSPYYILIVALLLAAGARSFLYGSFNGATDLFVTLLLLHALDFTNVNSGQSRIRPSIMVGRPRQNNRMPVLPRRTS